MPWRNGQYFYTTRVLKAIARGYNSAYQGLEISWQFEEMNPFRIAEYLGDFIIAINKIGRGHWTGIVHEFSYYKRFGKLQRAIIAEIVGVKDEELTELGFYDRIILQNGIIRRVNNVARLRGYGYHLMKLHLNGGS